MQKKVWEWGITSVRGGRRKRKRKRKRKGKGRGKKVGEGSRYGGGLSRLPNSVTR